MPATTIPPSAASTPPCAFAAITGAMNAKLEPVYDGTRLLRDQVEEDRPDAGEEDRRRDREAGEHRHQRGRAEHREDVLGAEAEHGRHVQPLVRPHHRARLYGAAVPVDLPHLVQTGSHIPLLVAANASREVTFFLARRDPSPARRPAPDGDADQCQHEAPERARGDHLRVGAGTRRAARSRSELALGDGLPLAAPRCDRRARSRNCSVVRRAAAPISRWPTPASGPVTVASASYTSVAPRRRRRRGASARRR